MKKRIIIGSLIGLALGYGTWFLYQRNLRRKADQAIDNENEALKKLQEAQGSIL